MTKTVKKRKCYHLNNYSRRLLTETSVKHVNLSWSNIVPEFRTIFRQEPRKRHTLQNRLVLCKVSLLNISHKIIINLPSCIQMWPQFFPGGWEPVQCFTMHIHFPIFKFRTKNLEIFSTFVFLLNIFLSTHIFYYCFRVSLLYGMWKNEKKNHERFHSGRRNVAKLATLSWLWSAMLPNLRIPDFEIFQGGQIRCCEVYL